jgi:hypothetical protein
MNALATGLTDTERVAIQILMDRAIMDKIKELNGMADNLNQVKALPNALKKMFDKLNEHANRAVEDIEGAGDRGHQVVDKFADVAKQTHAALDDVEKTLAEGGSNSGPL